MKPFNEMTAEEFALQTYHNHEPVESALIGRTVSEKIQFYKDVICLNCPHTIKKDLILVDILSDMAQTVYKHHIFF